MDEKRIVKIVWMIKAFLIIVLVYGGFRAITGRLHVKAFDPGTVSGDEPLMEPEPAAAETKSPSDYSEILQRDLFSGAGQAADGRNSQDLDSMPSAEDLGLRLVGAIAGGPAISRANIQNVKSKTTGVYRIGDTVASATIETIRQDAVVLRYEGRQLILRLHTEAPAGESQSDESQTEEKMPPADKQATTLPPVKADYVSEIFRKATVEPYVKDGRTEGLRITGLDKIPMAEMFGLRNGDIVQNVNGQQLTSKQKAFQVLMKAKTQSKVDIQLLRSGKSKNLSFNR
ncbi:MAG: type II secretion system protein N [Solirubrobacterales bacterium]